MEETITRRVAEAIAQYEANRTNTQGTNTGPSRTAPQVQQTCSYKDFLNCKPTYFHGVEGAVGLLRWFEKLESVFRISKCSEADKVKFATCTLQDSALT